MNLAALLPLLFWLVVGLLVGFPSGSAYGRRSERLALAKRRETAVKRANIAAVPQTPTIPSGFAQAGRRSPYLMRSRVDPDKTAELREIKPDNPWNGFPTE